MKRNIILTLSLSQVLFWTGNALAVETEISGFGSIVGTTLLSDEGYWVKHPSGAGLYDNGPNGDNVGLELEEESLVGVQGSIYFNDKLSITGQAIMRGNDDWEPKLDTIYASYNFSNQLNFKVGKFRNPVYLFSDVMDTHYAFGWLRTPSSSYSLSANFIEGISAQHLGTIGEVNFRTIGYYGRSRKDPDPFLTELFINRGFNSKFTNGNVDQNGDPVLMTSHKNDIQDAFGITIEAYYESLTFHAAYMDASGEKDVKTYADNSIYVEKYDNREFKDIAISYDDGDYIAIAEWNQYVDVYSSFYVTVGAYFGEYQVLLTRGEFDGEVVTDKGFKLPDSSQEFSDITSISLRYDYSEGVALKLELLAFNNENSLIVRDSDGDGEISSSVLSFGIDFIF